MKKAAPITAPEPPARPAPLALEPTIPAPPPRPSALPSPKPLPRAEPRARPRTEDRVTIFGVLVLAIVAGAFLAFMAYVDSHVTRGGPSLGADASSQAGAYRR